MAETSGVGGLGALAIGGIASVAVVLGGVVLVQMGVFGGGEAPKPQPKTEQQEAQNGGSSAAVISPSATAANSQPATEPAEAAADSRNAGTDETAAAETEETTSEPAPETAADTPAETETAEAAPETQPQTEDSAAAEQPAASADTDVAEEQPSEDAAAAETETAALAPADGGSEASAAPEDAAASDQAEEAASPAAAPETDQVQEQAFVLQAPELDLVRVDPQGETLVAGRAQEGVLVEVLLDGASLDRIKVPAGGEFVSFLSIEPAQQPQVISLLARFDGQQVVSDASFILAPASPAPVAENAAPETLAASDAPASEDAQVAALEQTAPESADSGEDQSAEAGGTAAQPEAEQTAETTQQPTPEQDGDTAAAAAPAPEPAPAKTEPEPQTTAVAVLKADEEGVILVQPAAPAAPELAGKVVLDTISYNGDGTVQLAGRAGDAAIVRVYLNNKSQAEIAVADGNWSGSLSGVEPGIYTLRLDAISSGGKVLSRLETPFKREAPEVLQPPAPAADATAEAAPLVRAVTVQKGDTLWAISNQRYGSGYLYVRVFEANKDAIRDPDLIYPGQVFTIPE